MTRHIICDEGIEIRPDIFLVEGATKWEDGAVVAVTNSQFDIIGKASDIRREGKNLSAEIDFEFPKSYQCAFYLDQLESHVFQGTRFITSGRLREVNLYPIEPVAPISPEGETDG